MVRCSKLLPAALSVGLFLGALSVNAAYTRWRGWGMFLWDYESDRIEGTETRWRLSRHWGFTTPALGFGAPMPGEAEALAPEGVRIFALEPTGPAEHAGLRSGDLILSADGKPLSHPADLQVIMENSFPGQQLRLKFLRGPEKVARETTLTVEARYIPQTPPPPLLRASRRAPQPHLQPRSKGAVLRMPGPLEPWLSSGNGAAVNVQASADRIDEEEFPARAGRPRSIIYHLTGNVEIRFQNGLRILSPHPVTIRWTEGETFTQFRLGATDQQK